MSHFLLDFMSRHVSLSWAANNIVGSMRMIIQATRKRLIYRRDQREIPRARSVYASPIALAQFRYVPLFVLPSFFLCPSRVYSIYDMGDHCLSSFANEAVKLTSRALPPMNAQGEVMVPPR